MVITEVLLHGNIEIYVVLCYISRGLHEVNILMSKILVSSNDVAHATVTFTDITISYIPQICNYLL